MSVIFVVADGTGFAHYSVLFQDPLGRRIFKKFKHSILVNTSPVRKTNRKSKCLLTHILPDGGSIYISTKDTNYILKKDIVK